MSKIIQRILLALLVGVLALQIFQIDQSNPPVQKERGLMAAVAPPADVSNLLEKACYDCHSHQTRYPWYARIQPVGWWLKKHIEQGREHLNFSDWASYNAEKKAHKAMEAAEEVAEEHMPIRPYLLTHAEARLSQEQRQRLARWFEALAASGESNISEKVRQSVPPEQLPPRPAEATEDRDQ